METIQLIKSFSNTTDGVFAVDEDQRIVHWNKGAERILGYTSRDAVGRYCYDIIKGIDQSSRQVCYLGCPVIDCAKNGYPTPGQDVKVKAKDGSSRWLSVAHTYIGSEGQTEREGLSKSHSNLAAVIHIFRDATEGMEAKRTLERVSKEVSAYASPETVKEPEVHQHEDLTDREQQVVNMLAQGEGTHGIAQKLMISNATARNHIQNILVKLNVHNRLEAVAYVLRNRVIDSE
ncbi:MAG: PAS domain S-box protein [Chloroflexi bacterium]|nr:PAS domain S-box protein [Chloroflexota bacterium]